jgi:hypothetical protein
MAGIVPSFELVRESASKEWWVNAIVLGLVVLSGPGVSLLVYFSAENLGYLHNSWLNTVEKARQEWENAQKQIMEFYSQELAAWQVAFEKDYRSKGRALIFNEQTYTVKRQPKEELTPQTRAGMKIQEAVKHYLASLVPPIDPKDVGVQPGDLISPMEIAVALGIVDENGNPDSQPVRTALNRLRKKSRM